MFSVSQIRLAKLGPSKGRGPLRDKRCFNLERPYYKGFGAVGLGRHTKKAYFILKPEIVPMYKVPDLSNFELSPYVSRRTPVLSRAKGWWPKQKMILTKRETYGHAQPKFDEWV